MNPKLVKTEQANYERRTWAGTNYSGIKAISDQVLVLPDEASNKIGKLGILEAPDELVGRQTLASETGLIADLGDGAFVWNSDRTRQFEGSRPRIGQRVYFARYSGQIAIGKDGKTYRLMDDKCIGAIEDEA